MGGQRSRDDFWRSCTVLSTLGAGVRLGVDGVAVALNHADEVLELLGLPADATVGDHAPEVGEVGHLGHGDDGGAVLHHRELRLGDDVVDDVGNLGEGDEGAGVDVL
eukprot:202924_1